MVVILIKGVRDKVIKQCTIEGCQLLQLVKAGPDMIYSYSGQ